MNGEQKTVRRSDKGLAQPWQALSVVSRTSLVHTLLCLSAIAVWTVYDHRKAAIIFKDTCVAPPPFVAFLISTPPLLYLAVVVAVLIALVAKEAIIRSKWITLGINVVAFVLGLTYLKVYTTALWASLVCIR